MLEKIKENIKSEKYLNTMKYPRKPEGYKKENYVYDENKTVKWNREYQEELTNKYIEELMNFQEETNKLENKFKKELIENIMEEFQFNQVTAEIVYRIGWEEGHSTGLLSVVEEAIKYAELAEEILIANKK